MNRPLDYQPRLFNTVTTLIIVCLLLVVVLAGCATAVPVTARFPEPPGKAAMTVCVDLEKLKDEAKLSDIAKTITQNYTSYYECAVKTDTWIEWYNTQKIIFERAGK